MFYEFKNSFYYPFLRLDRRLGLNISESKTFGLFFGLFTNRNMGLKYDMIYDSLFPSDIFISLDCFIYLSLLLLESMRYIKVTFL
jgi:hypothetical protein